MLTKKCLVRLHAETILFQLNTLEVPVISVRSMEIFESTILLHFLRKNVVVVVVGGKKKGKKNGFPGRSRQSVVTAE